MKFAGLDIETWGTQPEYALQPWRAKQGKAWLTSIVGLPPEDTPEIPKLDLIRMESSLEFILQITRRFLIACAEQGVHIATWNGPFDMAFLIALGLYKEVMACKWIDGLLLYRHYQQHPTFEAYHEGIKKMSFSLKAAVRQFIPEHAGYEEDVEYNPVTLEQWNTLRVYNRRDVRFTMEIVERLWWNLTPAQRAVAMHESKCLPMMALSIANGIDIDTDAAESLSQQLRDTSALKYMQLKLNNPEVSQEILASPAQLAELLKGWGLPTAKLTAKGAFSTDKDALDQLAARDPRAKLIAEIREAKGNCTKFAEAPLISVAYNGDGHTYPVPRVYGTYSGRLTYSSSNGKGVKAVPTGIALHQWKRGAEFRKVIKPPEGFTLCEFDFSGQEFRWMAVQTRDQTMLSLCAPGEDAHAYMGSMIAQMSYPQLRKLAKEGDAEAKKKRQHGKLTNLSCQYAVGVPRLMTIARVQYGVHLSLLEAETISTTYRRAYRGVPAYWKRQRRWAEDHDYVENMIGRRVHFLPVCARSQDYSWSYGATAINFPIQSIGADQKYLALSVARNILPDYNAYFYYELHDGLFFIVPHLYAKAFVKRMKHVLSNLPYEKAWGLHLPIQFPVDAKFGPSWGELEDFND